jgi:pilus assembly protein CpaC
LNTRSVNTTVDLREGQWLALAGLLQDEQQGAKARVPLLGDLPILEMIFSSKSVSRGETELVIMVSPEIIHPIDAKEVPLVLPGMEVTEPTDWALFLRGRIEGRQGCDHRSTVWPTYQERVIEAKHRASWDSMRHAQFQQSERYYIYGAPGFTE